MVNFHRALLWTLAISCLAGGTVLAQDDSEAASAPPGAIAATDALPTVPVPNDPLGRGTPRSSVEAFFGAAREGDFARATQYLDLSRLPADSQAALGARLARQLWLVLERQARIDFSALSSNALGNTNDGLPANRERLAQIEWPGGLVDADLERLREPGGLEIWRISSGSVERIPKLYERYRLRWAERYLSEATVDAFLKARVLGLSGVTWLNLAFVIFWFSIIAYISVLLTRWGIRRMRAGDAAHVLAMIHVPVVLLVVTVVVRNLIPPQFFSAEFMVLFRAQTILIVAAVWILARLVDFAAEKARARLLARDGDAGFHFIGLLRRIARVTLLLIGIVVWLDNLGFKVTTILASLGIVGLAVGLASKNFIEDLIGAMTLHGTGIVKRREVIRFGGQRGVVEDIGLRLTTIRTREGSVLTMPNATFAAMQIENLGRRDKFLFRPRLGLRYETTPDQLRQVLSELRKLLDTHPKVISEEARVRFARFGAYSLDLDIHCFISETEYAQYLAVAEDLNLRIIDIVAEAGTAFAFPSQTIYFERGKETGENDQELV